MVCVWSFYTVRFIPYTILKKNFTVYFEIFCRSENLF